ncbi:MAG: CsbD family protein [Bryobacterales bacterium]|nr:CsbD family protein [Bryobacterales bacterium]
MNWDRVEGNWKQIKGKAREQWGKLTDSDWEQVAGKKDQLVGRIQERYGISRDEAQKQADEWAKAQSDASYQEHPTHHTETVKR